MLGVLISRASGVSFEAFLAERIFGPLEMTDTGFSVPLASLRRLPAELMTNFATGETVVFDAPDGQWSAPRCSAISGPRLRRRSRISFFADSRASADRGDDD